ncbi:hypothetical protein L861_02580 [Litchfieldella anticariensis FP35 = DSM 16096]|uniref:Uncharacterized protein n=2 Tax=Litchfieldella anticariensis TaxID=258591 RepID=S2L8P9_LITA3|nr:hypothetical protein L861_02580 [Halomonas anticariensis FP35 = DSM 16096]
MSMGVHRPEQYQISEFDTFEKFLFEWLINQDVSKIDYIFRPQYTYVCDANNCLMVDYLGKVESLDNNIKEVERKIGRKILIGHENSTSDNSDYHDSYSNKDMIEIVKSVYKKDIELFGYHF